MKTFLSTHKYPVYTGKNLLSKEIPFCKGSVNQNRLQCTISLSDDLHMVAFKTNVGKQPLEFDKERINYFITNRLISIRDFAVLKQSDNTSKYILYIEENRFTEILSEISISQYDILKISCKFIYIERIVSYNKFLVLNRPGEYISDFDSNFDIRGLLIHDNKFCYYDNTILVRTPPPRKRAREPPKINRKKNNDQYPYGYM